MSNTKKYKVKVLLRKRGVTMPPATATKETKTASIKNNKYVMDKISQSHKEAKMGQTVSLRELLNK